MPRLRELKTNFVAGELDDLLQGRSDIKHYFNGADYARNVIVLPQGGARTRPGTRYLWEVPEVSPGVRSNVKLCTFQFSTEQTYLFVFHHLTVTIFRNNAVVATVVTPWESDDLVAHITDGGDLLSSGISWTQSVDTLIVFHEDFAPRKIMRTGSHTSWALSAWELKNIPRFAFGGTTYVNGVDEVQELELASAGAGAAWNVGDTFSLILEDEETDNVRYGLLRGDMATLMAAALNRLPNIDASTPITVTYPGAAGDGADNVIYTVTFPGNNGKRPWGALGYSIKSAEGIVRIDTFVTVKGEYPGEDTWSLTRGYPRCGTFFQGRLWMAGSRSLPNTLWASRSGDPNDFNSKRLADDYGIVATSDTDDVPAFLNLYAGRHLQIFSTAGEFYVPSSESEAVTAANIVLRRTTSRGAKAGLRVAEVDGATIFVQRRGQALREFIFADVELAYQANNISLLASHLMRDPVGMALRRSSSTNDADYLFMPNADGTMTVFCTLRTQDVNAFTLWNTAGAFTDVAAVLDEVYFSTVREIDGEELTFIEVMDDTLSMDCAVVSTDLVSPAPSSTVTHLPDTLCAVNLDGYPQSDILSDGAGLVTFERDAETSYAIGLGWPEVLPDEYPGLQWLVKTLPIEGQLPDGAMTGRKRRIVNLSVRLYGTTGLILNGNRVSFQQFGALVLDQPPREFTGIKHLRGLLGWDYEGAVVMGDNRATKATILGLAWAVSI